VDQLVARELNAPFSRRRLALFGIAAEAPWLAPHPDGELLAIGQRDVNL